MSNEKSIEQKVLDIFSTILKKNVTTKDTKLSLNNWDSLKNIELIFALEDELDFEFTEAEIEKFNDVEGIIKLICEKNAT